jgi:hypothetical protein
MCTTAIISILKNNTLAKKPGDIMQALPSGKLCYFHLYLFAPHALQKKPVEEHQKDHEEIRRCSACSII